MGGSTPEVQGDNRIMNTHEISKNMLERSRMILEEVEYLHQKGIWNLVVCRSQQAVELALKAVLGPVFRCLAFTMCVQS